MVNENQNQKRKKTWRCPNNVDVKALPPNVTKSLKYFGICYNEDAVVMLTKKHVPGYVKLIVSLGKSFNYCAPVDNSSAVDLLISMKKIMAGCDQFEQFYHMDHLYNKIRRELLEGKLQQEKPSNTQSYIYQLFKLTENFLKKHRKIVVIPADKGGKMVIMDRDDYMAKANSYIADNVGLGNYVEEIDRCESEVVLEVEGAFGRMIKLVDPYLRKDETLSEPLRLESYSIPLFYGCPKIHKEGTPLRPIIAAVNMMGDFVSSWILDKLELIADHLGMYKVKNSCSIVTDLRNFKVEPGHVLSSYDYVAMYTNIDVQETLTIISNHYFLIQPTTSVPMNVFIRCLEFFIVESTFFKFNGRIFKQCKGLAMGNRLAQILAEIRTDHALAISLQGYDAELISFIFKYVDDIVSASKEDEVRNIMERISVGVGMDLTLTTENEMLEVDFLDCTLNRNADGSISTKWLKKKFCSLSVLNFHSYHPWQMKRNVVNEMVKRAFFFTSLEHEQYAKETLSVILTNSSYPELFILESVHLNPWNIPPQRVGVQLNHKYVSCPYIKPVFSMIKKTMADSEITYKLAPTSSANNRNKLLSRLKDPRDSRTLKNSIFEVKCGDCSFSKIFTTTGNLNVRESLRKYLSASSGLVHEHITGHPEHRLNQDVEILRSFRSIKDSERSEWILKDVESLNGALALKQ